MFMKKAFHIILILISLKSFGQEVLVSSVVTPDQRFIYNQKKSETTPNRALNCCGGIIYHG